MPRKPPTAALGAAGLERARQEYVDSLRGRGERGAFEQGYAMGKAGTATWGPGPRNLGDSGFAGAQSYTRRQSEAFAMGIHFANEEAKLPGVPPAGSAPGN